MAMITREALRLFERSFLPNGPSEPIGRALAHSGGIADVPRTDAVGEFYHAEIIRMPV
jgi:hypothetical protein